MPDRSQATTRSGTPCRTRPQPGSQWCIHHDPALAQQRAQWAVRGGLNKARSVQVATAMVRTLPTTLGLDEVTAIVGKALIEAASGQMAPGQAAGVASLAHAYAMLAQLARVTISLSDANALLDTLIDVVLAADLPYELREHIAQEFGRRTDVQRSRIRRPGTFQQPESFLKQAPWGSCGIGAGLSARDGECGTS